MRNYNKRYFPAYQLLEDAEEPEDYEGDWYSYAKVRNIAKRASNIPDADESYDASAKKSQSSVKKYSGYQIAEDLFTRRTIDVYGLGYECEVQSQGYDLTGKHRTYRLWWSHYDNLFWDIRVRNHGESFDLNYVPGINYSHERMDNVSWDTIAEVIKGDIDLWYKMGIVEKSHRGQSPAIRKQIWKQYPQFAEEYVEREIEDAYGGLSIEKTPQDAIQSEYRRDYEEPNTFILKPSDEYYYTEVKLTSGKVIKTYEMQRSRSVNFDEVVGVIGFSEGYYSIWGNVAIRINEEQLMDDIHNENIPDKDISVIFYPEFY